jgi:hypothetical protein
MRSLTICDLQYRRDGCSRLCRTSAVLFCSSDCCSLAVVWLLAKLYVLE